MKTWIPLLSLAAALDASATYQLHEWGTFTTVSGSDGVLLTGLQREEEPLPPFVHSHFGFENGQMPNIEQGMNFARRHGTLGYNPPNSKGFGRRPVSNVTVKMETPVLYFHSDSAFKAHVEVGFQGGTISQWYPDRSGGETLPELPPSPDPEHAPTPLEKWNIDFSQPYRGAITWDVDVLSPAESRSTLTFKPKDSLIWLRARLPEANVLRTASGETENYLFYRGIGNFTPGLKTTVTADETLHLENHTGGDIPFLLVFEQTEGKVRWHAETKPFHSGDKLDLAESTLTDAADGFASPVYQTMKTGLAASGLTPAEADAMVQTWWTSYFERDGLRVFWIVPRAVTDKILPLTVTPAPETLVRTLVGRSEVLRPRQEATLLATSRKADSWQYLVNNDRFGLALQERIQVLNKSTAAAKP